MSKTGLGIQELLYYERSQILAIAQKHGAYNVRVFGSVARGEATPESDIDLLVDYDLEKITPWFPGGLLLDLEQLLNRKVDIAERGYVERTHSRARFAGGCTTMRREAERLQDILDAIAAIERYASQGRQAFDNQELIQM
jgi:predicted nucleotidyltransferase